MQRRRGKGKSKEGKKNNETKDAALAAYILRQWQVDLPEASTFGQGCQASLEHIDVLQRY